MTDPDRTHYEPFPDFAEWADTPVDAETLSRFTAVLDELRDGTDSERLSRARQTATRLAAIDTGAIEGLYDVDRGFTMTVALGAAAWEATIDAREPVVRRSFEDALRAYDFVLDLATSNTELSEKAIREIHAVICASQEKYRVWTQLGWQEQALPKGKYKQLPNNPTVRSTGKKHFYAPPADVSGEMNRLIRELRTAAFASAHSVLQAAYAHYAFVAIHPFADGNGRVARALASVYLYRNPGVPLAVLVDDKDEYLDALGAADDGDPTPLVRFVENRLMDVIGLVQIATSADAPDVGTSIASLRSTFLTEEGLTLKELDAIGLRLADEATSELERQLTALGLPDGVEWHQIQGQQAAKVDETLYRTLRDGHRMFWMSGHSTSAHTNFTVAVRKAGSTDAQFQIIADSGQLPLPVELREVYPKLTTMFTIKLRTWVDTLVRNLLADFDEQARKALRRR